MSDQILIFDDDQESTDGLSVAEEWKDDLEEVLKALDLSADYEVHLAPVKIFREAVSVLEDRRQEARGIETEDRDFSAKAKQLFDDTEILFVDYDLIKVAKGFAYTGERVAYLARCYSNCGYIVALNQFEDGKSTFDLTLKDHLEESFADLNISNEDISNEGLWATGREDSHSPFRPWYWPTLPDAADRLEDRTEQILSDIEAPILETIGLDLPEMDELPRSVVEFMTDRNTETEETFEGFVTDSGNGLRRRDQPWNDRAIAKIAASRIGKWMEFRVLQNQDILMDAPHLVAQMPSRLQGDRENLDNWNQTCSVGSDAATAIDEANFIEGSRYPNAAWLSRPAWYWHKIRNNERIDEVSDPWSTKEAEYFFCEDASCFEPEEEVEYFVSDLPTPFARRYVKRLEKPNYRPRIRFSL